MNNDLRGYVLRFTVGGREQSHQLDADRVVLGRSPGCDVVVPEERVSREHATILREGDDWAIFDMGSANGTFVNDKPVVKTRLKHGDKVTLGETDMEFRTVAQNQTCLHEVILAKDEAKRSKTTVLDMAELSVISSIGDPKPGKKASVGETGQAAALAIQLFNHAAQALLTSRVLDEVLDKVMDLVFQNLPADHGVIALHDDEHGIVPRVSRARDGTRASAIRVSQSIAEEAITKGQALLVGDVRADRKFSVEESVMAMNISSAMCAPMYNDGRVSGFIYVDRADLRTPFTEDHLRLLSTFGIFSAIAVEQTRLRRKIDEEARMRERLERYNSPAVVDRIRRGALTTSQHALGELVIEEKEVSILFSDLCGFTQISERLAANAVARLLNGIFERLTNEVFKEEGTLDKYMGDGMMAFFGAPEPQVDHAVRSVRAALKMQKALDDLNAESDRDPVRMRIGINSGRVVAGDIGAPKRRDYTVIGDAVNVAARLESSVAQPGQVIIGKSTYDLVSRHFECNALGAKQLKGKEQVVEAWLVLREL